MHLINRFFNGINFHTDYKKVLLYSLCIITFTPTHAHATLLLPAHIFKMSYIPANPHASLHTLGLEVYGYIRVTF